VRALADTDPALGHVGFQERNEAIAIVYPSGKLSVYSFPMHALGLATVTRRHVMLHRSLEAH
jgi:hypothetical protein